MSNNGGVYTFSKTAATNASADSTINWQEGQPPSSVNDSARAMMASIAKWRDDIGGVIITTGTSAAYSVASNQVFDTLADFHGQIIAFTPHVTNAAGPVTMTVDGFANLPLRTAPNTELLAGIMIAGTPYTAMYNNTDGALYLHGYYSNPYNVPLLGGMDFWDTVAPNTRFIFPQGQAISRTTYAAAFARWGTTFGVGDGSTTFNVPDKRGRVSAMIDGAGAVLTGSYFANAGSIGTIGGSDHHALTLGELPTGITSVTPGVVTVNTLGNVLQATGGGNWNLASAGSGGNAIGVLAGNIGGVTNASSFSTSGAVGVTSNNTSGAAHALVQPTITCNYIIRII